MEHRNPRASALHPSQSKDETMPAADKIETDDLGGVTSALDPRQQATLGAHLKAVYDEIVSQPLPERFLSLLAQLETKEGGGA